MRALVTGGGGFLGAEIVRQLCARGDEVATFARGDYPQPDGVTRLRGDLRDGAQVAAACADKDVVFHVAAKAGFWGSRADYVGINVDGTRHVIDGCRAHGVGRLVYTSSPSVVIGDQHLEGVDETHPYPDRYLAHYPQTKAQAERLSIGANSAELRTCSLRPHLIWGPGDNHLIPRLLARARAGKLIQVGDGSNKVDVIHVANAAAAHLAAADRLVDGSPVPGSTYFINQDEPLRLWDFIDRILVGCGLDAMASRPAISFRTAWRVGRVMELAFRILPGEPRLTRFLACQLAHHHYFDGGKARRELEWSPAISVDDGLADLIERLNVAAVPAP